jgi:ATP-dependent RNA helicase RhlE
LTSFNDFGLAEPILRALAEEKYETPTPIQAQTIPFALTGRDIVGIAQTGTGKTAAFALPILNHLSQKRVRPAQKACRVLVLSPTRELSGQITDSFRAYGRHIRPMAIELAIGGVPINRQARALSRGVEVLVATPGRLLDLVYQRSVTLEQVEVLVLDEADRMLDMGFIRDIKKIVQMLPKKRQTLFFSATMPGEITSLAEQMLTDPARVSVTPQATTVERIAQRVILTDKSAKPDLLAGLLKTETVDRVLVFTRTKHGADKVVRNLEKSGFAAAAIHGNKSQSQRERVLADFRNGKLRILIATDIAARGIDVDGVSHVINYDLPNIPESYVHRIGRTARAGREGIAISFCDHEENAFLRDIERTIRIKIPSIDQRTGGARSSAQPAPHHHANGRNEQSRHRGRGGPGHRNGPGGNGHQDRPQRANGHQGGGHQADQNGRPAVQSQPEDIGTVKFMQPAPGQRSQGERAPGHRGGPAHAGKGPGGKGYGGPGHRGQGPRGQGQRSQAPRRNENRAPR